MNVDWVYLVLRGGTSHGSRASMEGSNMIEGECLLEDIFEVPQEL